MFQIRFAMHHGIWLGLRDSIVVYKSRLGKLGRVCFCSSNFNQTVLNGTADQSDRVRQPEPTCKNQNLVECWCALNLSDHSTNKNPDAHVVLCIPPHVPRSTCATTVDDNFPIATDVKTYDAVNFPFPDPLPNAPTRLVTPVLGQQPVLDVAVRQRYMQIVTGLSKARLSGLVVSTSLAGCALAASTSMAQPEFVEHYLRIITCLGLGTGLTSAAANTVNQIMEIPYDSQMLRTRNRVLVRGLITPGRASLFALGCASTGLGLLYFGVNPLVAALAGGNILLYTMIYTPLKRLSQANTWIGALVGAIPPLMGWAAATGQLQSGSLILASLLYVWQFPHFMALSWNLKHEYSKAGYVMTSILDPDLCKRVALRHAFCSSLVCLAGAGCSAISLGPWAGCALGLACLPANIGLIYYAWQFAKPPEPNGGGSSAAARRLFKATLFHLPVVMSAALIGTYLCATSS